MNLLAKFFLFSGVLAASVFGTPPPSQDAAPTSAPSDFMALPPAVRLGVKFDPAARNSNPRKTSILSPVAGTILPDATDPDAVQMEPFVVRERRAKLTDTEVLSDKAAREYAMNEYLSPAYRGTFGPLAQLAAYYFNFPSLLNGWHPGQIEALTLYHQDERLRRLEDMDMLVRLETIGDPKDAKYFRELRFEAATVTR